MNKIIFSIVIAFVVSVAVAFFRPIEGLSDTIIVTIHNLGFILGTGAATIINIFNIIADKDEKLRQVKMSAARFLFRFVWAGTLLMLFVHTEEFIGEQDIIHWAKFISIIAILAGVSYIWFSLFPRVKKLMPQPGGNPSPDFLAFQRQLKILPPLVLFFWYMDFFLNSFWLPAWHF